MRCDMRSGACGGPWFHSFDESSGTGIQDSVNSFGDISFPNTMFGPYFGTQAQRVYQQAQSA
jgi:hypothetical protein